MSLFGARSATSEHRSGQREGRSAQHAREVDKPVSAGTDSRRCMENNENFHRWLTQSKCIQVIVSHLVSCANLCLLFARDYLREPVMDCGIEKGYEWGVVWLISESP